MFHFLSQLCMLFAFFYSFPVIETTDVCVVSVWRTTSKYIRDLSNRHFNHLTPGEEEQNPTYVQCVYIHVNTSVIKAINVYLFKRHVDPIMQLNEAGIGICLRLLTFYEVHVNTLIVKNMFMFLVSLQILTCVISVRQLVLFRRRRRNLYCLCHK